ncbi:hypothetical protein [Actinomadura opuntiae]|uniref:hypothetical protein n=1 Tax=Actinomadura sp. OS1-43 TaxID=604315 RepID=UPI00255ABA56|nr:hypothetical protein [Actinomadura sp. OS1-43]MDL4812814.1 hypothetical protein [Actinomadura sp. OS1-43]
MAEPWAPSLTDVGGKIPTRTRDYTDPGDDTPTGTFSDRTVPTAEMVQPTVDGAVTAVRSAVSQIPDDPRFYALAREAAAWRAAADIELAWPERDGDIREVYDRLDARAKLALQELVDACDDAGTGVDGGTPSWEFPRPVPWGDDYL